MKSLQILLDETVFLMIRIDIQTVLYSEDPDYPSQPSR